MTHAETWARKELSDARLLAKPSQARPGTGDIEWVDSQLGEFAGRAVRDKWVEQCKKLSSGWRRAKRNRRKTRVTVANRWFDNRARIAPASSILL